jgi:hypothetical protein
MREHPHHAPRSLNSLEYARLLLLLIFSKPNVKLLNGVVLLGKKCKLEFEYDNLAHICVNVILVETD